MRKIKVLQFPISTNNGVKQYAMNNWNYIDHDKFQFDFALVRNDPSIASELKQSGAGVKQIVASADADQARYITEVKALLSENYDVVHLHTSFWKRLLIEELAVACHVPKIIVHSHTTLVDIQEEEKRKKAESLHFALRDQFDLSLATDLCACSRAAADWLFGAQIPRDKIQIMKNAIDVERFVFAPQLRTAARKKLGLEDQFVIGHIGRFTYQKNHEFLIDTFFKVKKQIPKAKLLLIGEGPLLHSTKEKVTARHLTDDVIFAGQRSDVPDLLQAMDVFCLPSRFEGLGIVLIEAQAAGLPCLVSPYIPEDGIITSLPQRIPLDSEAWAEGILTIALERPSRENMLRDVSASGYNIKRQIKEIERLYSM